MLSNSSSFFRISNFEFRISAAVAAVFSQLTFAADVPRALPPGQLPDDARLGLLKELDGYFPWTPPASREAWEKRGEQVRTQVRVALGIFPEPTRTPLNAVIHGRIERDDYTVEKVFFESMPGLFVTGNLYRPRGKPGPFPAVLCPHGHWKDARFMIRTDAEMQKEIESGGERFAESGRSMFQSIGVQLARMGIVAFVYDMLGNSDSQQIGIELAHGFKKQRPEMNTRENWGLFSPQAETHAQSVMGLQTWNSIRALDFLTSLPEVDAKRLACTGASGGGTQTMILAAVDPRLAVECPAVMVSTAMQGGCTCENASLLRVGTGNIEFAALFAPKPLGMTAANDWTKEMETKGFPELKQHYAKMGAPQNVALWAHTNFPHNYNIVTREHIYAWFNEHFQLGLGGDQLREREFPLLQKSDLTVWDDAHPAPPGGDDFERRLLHWWHDDAQAQLAKSADERRKIERAAWQTIVGWGGYTRTKFEHPRELTLNGGGKNFRASICTSRAEDGAFESPEILVDPHEYKGLAVLWLDERGKGGLFAESGELRPEVLRLLEAGARVVGIDLFEQGEFRADGTPVTQTRRTKNPREAACFTFGYNRALFAQRVQDICECVARMNLTKEPARCTIVALDGTGPLAAVALAVQPEIAKAAINTGGFRFGNVLDLQSPDFLPAAAKYGDIPGALELAAPRPLYVLGEPGSAPDASPAGAIDWLLR
ncbi:MAG TPA: alpha/beta hydrolase family protein [Chthoniobacteraceae bacterium]|nr:alpha/beta hydrolase family protein [Chthoniobacteraceae bacterium]